jgi:hypothetical protein
MVYGNDEPPSNSYRNAFVITHGIGSNQQIYNDVWSFDFIRECWVEIKATGDIPEPRYNAIGGIDLTRMSHLNQMSTEYLIFSHGKNKSKYFTDTYILKLDGRSQQGDYSQLTAEWIKLNTSNAPSLKDGATGGVLSDDRLVVFGGCEEKGNCNGNGYFLDINFDYLRTNVETDVKWKEIKNECIRPKAYAASVRGSDQRITDYIENDRLIIFGGLTETKYGTDSLGEISIFDMDKKKFFGVQPSSKNDKEFPKATKGAKMIATAPKSGETNGFSIILYGGEPIDDDQWSTNIWKLDVSNNFSYYPTPPEGVTMTDCYTIKEVSEKINFDDDQKVDTSLTKKESIGTLLLFILSLIGIPVLIICSRALNCFTEKWKIIFLTLGTLNIILLIFNLIFSSKSKGFILYSKIILLCLMLVYMVFPFIRPKQPVIDINQDEVNAAGVPIEKNIEEKNKKNIPTSSSSSLLINPSIKNNQVNSVASEINGENESVQSTPMNGTRNLTVDSKYGSTNNKDGNNSEKRESFLSPVFINPSIKEEAEEDDETEDVGDSEIEEDEDEIIKKKYLSHAKIWLYLLRIIGFIILVTLIILTLLVSSSDESKLQNKKIFIYIWIILVAILYIVAIIIARRKPLLKARKISFRASEPLEPNRTNSWALPANNQMKRFSMVSDSSYGKTSAFDDIGNVSAYSQSVRNYNGLNMAQNTNNTNIPVINGSGNNNVSPSLGYSIPPLPVTPVYMNNNGLFSIQANYKLPNQSQSQSSSLVNQITDSGVYKASEMTNIPTSSSDYQSYKDMNNMSMNMNMNMAMNNSQIQNINNINNNNITIINSNNNNNGFNNNNEKYSSSSSLNSLNLKEEKINNGSLLYPLPTSTNNIPSPLFITNNNNGSMITLSNSNITNPSPQSQTQLLSQNSSLYILPSQNISNSPSPVLEESPIQINTPIEHEGNLDFPQRNDTIENMNDKEVMMVMTVPKRKLTVVNM